MHLYVMVASFRMNLSLIGSHFSDRGQSARYRIYGTRDVTNIFVIGDQTGNTWVENTFATLILISYRNVKQLRSANEIQRILFQFRTFLQFEKNYSASEPLNGIFENNSL